MFDTRVVLSVSGRGTFPRPGLSAMNVMLESWTREFWVVTRGLELSVSAVNESPMDVSLVSMSLMDVRESLILVLVVARVGTSGFMTRGFSVVTRDITLADVVTRGTSDVETRDWAEVATLASVVVMTTASSLENLQSSPHSGSVSALSPGISPLRDRISSKSSSISSP